MRYFTFKIICAKEIELVENMLEDETKTMNDLNPFGIVECEIESIGTIRNPIIAA